MTSLPSPQPTNSTAFSDMSSDALADSDILSIVERVEHSVAQLAEDVRLLRRRVLARHQASPARTAGDSTKQLGEETYRRLAGPLLRAALHFGAAGATTSAVAARMHVSAGLILAAARRLALETALVEVRRPVGRQGGSLYVHLAEGKDGDAKALLRKLAARANDVDARVPGVATSPPFNMETR